MPHPIDEEFTPAATKLLDMPVSKLGIFFLQ
jgi:hypothetical protein